MSSDNSTFVNDSGSRSQFLGRDLLPYTTRSEPQGRVQNKRILLLHKEGRVGLVHFLKCEAAFYIDRNLLMARAAPCIVSLAPCFSGYDKSFEGGGRVRTQYVRAPFP